MWNIAGDPFDTLEGVVILEVAHLSLDESKSEIVIFNDNEEVDDRDVEENKVMTIKDYNTL